MFSHHGSDDEMYTRFFSLIILHPYGGYTMRHVIKLRDIFNLYISFYPDFAEFNTNQLVNFWLDMYLHDLPERADWEPETETETENRQYFALAFLRCFLEITAFYSAKRCVHRQISSEHLFDLLNTNLNIARSYLYSNSFINLLHNYDRDIASLGTYVQPILISYIMEQGHGHGHGHGDNLSPWRRLYIKSKDYLREALIHQGYDNPRISQFILARECFRPVYNTQIAGIIGSGHIWPNPTPEVFEEAASVYNIDRLHKLPGSSSITGVDMGNWMTVCKDALIAYRDYLIHIIIISIDEFHELEANLDPTDEFLEDEELYIQVKNVVRQQLIFSSEQVQQVVIMYYDFNWKQKYIATHFSVKQSAISHCIRTFLARVIRSLSHLVGTPIDEYSIIHHAPIIRRSFRELMPDVLQVITKQACAKLNILLENRTDASNSNLVCTECLIILNLENKIVQNACANLGIDWRDCYHPSNIHQVLQRCLEIVGEGIVQEACANLNIIWEDRHEPSHIYRVFQECLGL